NTLEGFRTAAALGVDLIEFDVLPLPDGRIVVAHSLEELAPAAPLLDDVLDWFATETPEIGLHVDFKGSERVEDVARLLARVAIDARSVLSSTSPSVLHAAGRVSDRIRLALTYPDDRLGIAKRRSARPLVEAALEVLRATLPRRLPGLVRRHHLGALMLQHRVVSRAAV